MNPASWSAATWLALAWTGVVVAYGALANAWTGSDPGWYESRPTPSFQPPDWVFGVMWPLNFLALLVVGWWLPASVGTRAVLPLLVLVASVVAAVGWSWLFYAPHRLTAAAASLAAAALLTWLLVVLVARLLPAAGLVLVPYAAWLTVATALAVEYARTG